MVKRWDNPSDVIIQIFNEVREEVKIWWNILYVQKFEGAYKFVLISINSTKVILEGIEYLW